MPPLILRDGTAFRWPRAIGLAASWGVGAALGVAGGAWLTVVGEAGAPGVASLNPASDLLALPAMALAVVAATHLGLQLVFALARGRRSGGHPEE